MFKVEAVVVTILDTMADALARGDRVELRGFGAFDTKPLLERAARNPKTGAAVTVRAKKRIAFKPGKGMQERLNLDRTKIVDTGVVSHFTIEAGGAQ